MATWFATRVPYLLIEVTSEVYEALKELKPMTRSASKVPSGPCNFVTFESLQKGKKFL